LNNKKILDVGCGLGDLILFLNQKVGNNFSYKGIDISEDLIDSAKKEWSKENIKFEVSDIFEIRENDFDICLLSGALSYKIVDNEGYARSCIKRMFELSNDAIALNFLTSYVDFQVEKNHHYNPSDIFNFAKTLTKYVNLIHDYPLWEFTIQMFKTARNN
jgi:SAM-dependent methyltransferase